MTPSRRRSASVDSSWSEPLGIAVVARPAPDINEEVEDMAIEPEMMIGPEMIVGVDDLPRPPATPPARGSAIIPRPPIPTLRQPSFLDIPLGKPGSFGPAKALATGTAISQVARRRTTTVGHGHDSTSIVSPLPPPAQSSTHRAMSGAAVPRARVPRNWVTIGASAIATGAALAIVMALVSPRAPAITPPPATSVAVAALPAPAAATTPSPTRLAAPAKPTAVPPAPRSRQRVATRLETTPAPVATRPPATSLSPKAAAPAAIRPASVATRPAPAVARAHATATKPAAPAKLATRAAPKVVAQAAKQPMTHPPGKPVAKAATQAKRKTVASIDPKPVATKKKPATR